MEITIMLIDFIFILYSLYYIMPTQYDSRPKSVPKMRKTTTGMKKEEPKKKKKIGKKPKSKYIWKKKNTYKV